MTAGSERPNFQRDAVGLSLVVVDDDASVGVLRAAAQMASGLSQGRKIATLGNAGSTNRENALPIPRENMKFRSHQHVNAAGASIIGVSFKFRVICAPTEQTVCLGVQASAQQKPPGVISWRS